MAKGGNRTCPRCGKPEQAYTAETACFAADCYWKTATAPADDTPEVELLDPKQDSELRLKCFKAIALCTPNSISLEQALEAAEKLYNFCMNYEQDGEEELSDPTSAQDDDKCERRH